MQRDTSAPSEPDLLFSPEPSEKPRSSMTGERDKNSVLFKLDDIVGEQAKAIPKPVREESSGLVDIQNIVADDAVEQSPIAPTPKPGRDSSGLVDINKLLADEEAAKKAADKSAPVAAAIAPAVVPTSVPPEPGVEVVTPRPAIPTWMLVSVIVALAATIGVLAWKLL